MCNRHRCFMSYQILVHNWLTKTNFFINQRNRLLFIYLITKTELNVFVSGLNWENKNLILISYLSNLHIMFIRILQKKFLYHVFIIPFSFFFLLKVNIHLLCSFHCLLFLYIFFSKLWIETVDVLCKGNQILGKEIILIVTIWFST